MRESRGLPASEPIKDGAAQEGRGGLIGVLFMALTFTLTSFTCTFAFVGTVLVDAANGGRLWPAAGLFAFFPAARAFLKISLRWNGATSRPALIFV